MTSPEREKLARFTEEWLAEQQAQIDANISDERLRDVAHVIARYSADLVRMQGEEIIYTFEYTMSPVLRSLEFVMMCISAIDLGKTREELVAAMDEAVEKAHQRAATDEDIAAIFGNLFSGS